MTDFINVRCFEMERVKPGSTILVLGDRGTGKTCMAREILRSLRKYHLGVVMAGTLDTIEEYAQHVPRSLIYSEYSSETVQNMINIQNDARRKMGADRVKPMFLILDDLMFDKRTINKDRVFRDVWFNGRHYKITIILCAQYVKHLSAELRPNTDYVFTTFQKNSEQRNRILTEFDVGFPSRVAFRDIMLKCADNFGCMVLDKRSSATLGLEESVFHTRADIQRPFRVGDDLLWKREREGRRMKKGKAFTDTKRHIVVRKITRGQKAGWV